MAEKKGCPVCGDEDGNEEECWECQFLACPVCHHPVSWYGTETIDPAVSVCEHVVMWGVIGNDDATFELPGYEEKFAKLESERFPDSSEETDEEDDEEDDDADEEDDVDDETSLLKAFAKEQNLHYREQVDEHGPRCCGPDTAYFLFTKEGSKNKGK